MSREYVITHIPLSVDEMEQKGLIYDGMDVGTISRCCWFPFWKKVEINYFYSRER